MNAEKRHDSEIRIATNDESQGSIAKNLRCDELLYYTFIIHSAGERIFKIGEHFVEVMGKSSVSCFFDSRCRLFTARDLNWNGTPVAMR